MLSKTLMRTPSVVTGASGANSSVSVVAAVCCTNICPMMACSSGEALKITRHSEPSTTISPLCGITAHTDGIPVTSGTPNPRARMAVCDFGPHVSVTNPTTPWCTNRTSCEGVSEGATMTVPLGNSTSASNEVDRQ
jgi:hypothetical protein